VFGAVTDSSGAVVPNAVVTIVDTGTESRLTTSTDARGRYHFSGLPAGTFEITAERDQFKPARVRVILTVDEEAAVDLVLHVGDLHQSVPVTDELPMLQFTSPSMSGTVSSQELRSLPLNGRDLSQLILLQTGVIPTTTAGPSPWSDGTITKAAVQGSRPTMNNVTLDGGDINDPGFAAPPGGPTGAQLGVDAIREYRVLLNNYSAEFGRNGGANIQYVTRSGTNLYQASLFDFERNAAFDARNFFDQQTVPPFLRHQFGATLGGPIRKNRTFFFGNYEGLRESKSITSSVTVPDAQAHQGLLPLASNPAVLVNVGVNPAIAPVLNLFPQANGPEIGGGLAVLNTSRVQRTEENYYLARLDHDLSDTSRVTLRVVSDNGSANLPFQSTLVPGFDGFRNVNDTYALLGWQDVLSPNLFDEARLHFNRTDLQTGTANQQPFSISLVPGRPLGAFNIAGLPLIGNNFIYPLGSASNTYELLDNLSYHRGSHDLRVGGNYKRIQVNGPFDLFVNGEYSFSDLSTFGLTAQSNNTPLEYFLRAMPLLYFGVDPAESDSNRGFRQNYLGFYVQDEWRVLPRLTLNLGLRWEYWSVPSEANGRSANIRNLLTDTSPTVGPIWSGVPLDLWSPRFGFSWSPRASNLTVVRGGVGIFRDQFWENLYGNTRFYQPFYRPILSVFPNFVTSPGSLASIGGLQQVIGSFGITYRPSFPYYVQYNLSVQRQLLPDLMVEAAYAGSKGTHLVRTGEANLTPAGPLNPSFGSIPLLVTDANSNYNSGQLSVWKRGMAGLTLRASYTFSKSMDDQSGPFPSDWASESGVSQNFFDRQGDHARSSFDRTHVFSGSFLYAMPFGHSASGRLAKGWTLGGIATLMSGPPFTGNLGAFNNSGTMSSVPADRPDLKPGVNACAATLGNPNQWFNPSIFTLPAAGTYGNAGRNILCGPPLKNLDLSLSKRTSIGERAQAEFRVETFNVFNHANFAVPVNTQGPTGNGGNGDAIFSGRESNCSPSPANAGCGILAANVGRIMSTVGSSRQIQLALKITF
jgi:hypothetical protein